MELIEVILSKENLNRAYKKVVANKGAGGVDGVTVEELGIISGKTGRNHHISQEQNLYTEASPKSIYSERQWKEKTIGNTDSIRPNHPAGNSTANL